MRELHGCYKHILLRADFTVRFLLYSATTYFSTLMKGHARKVVVVFFSQKCHSQPFSNLLYLRNDVTHFSDGGGGGGGGGGGRGGGGGGGVDSGVPDFLSFVGFQKRNSGLGGSTNFQWARERDTPY